MTAVGFGFLLIVLGVIGLTVGHFFWPKGPSLVLAAELAILGALASCGTQLCGCTTSPLQTAADVANAASLAGQAAKPLLDAHCEAPMVKLHTEAKERQQELRDAMALAHKANALEDDIRGAVDSKAALLEVLDRARALAEICTPIVLTYDALQAAHVALRAGIVVAANDGNIAALAPLLGDITRAASRLAADIMQLQAKGQK